jgi:hypothetical protein
MLVGTVHHLYYRKISSYLLTPEKVYVDLALPLVRSYGDLWPIYDIRSLPMGLSPVDPIGYSLLQIEWPYVTTHPEQSKFILFTKATFDKCVKDTYYECPHDAYIEHDGNAAVCEIGLVERNASLIDLHCDPVIFPTKEIPVTALELTHFEYLISTPLDQVTLNCTYGQTNYTIPHLIQVNLPCGCMIHIGDGIKLSQDMPCEADYEMELNIKFPVNIALLPALDTEIPDFEIDMPLAGFKYPVNGPNITKYILDMDDIDQRILENGIKAKVVIKALKAKQTVFQVINSLDVARYFRLFRFNWFKNGLLVMLTLLTLVELLCICVIFRRLRVLAVFKTLMTRLPLVSSNLAWTTVLPVEKPEVVTVDIMMPAPTVIYVLSALFLIYGTLKAFRLMGNFGFRQPKVFKRCVKWIQCRGSTKNCKLSLLMLGEGLSSELPLVEVFVTRKFIPAQRLPSITTLSVVNGCCTTTLHLQWSAMASIMIMGTRFRFQLPDKVKVPIHKVRVVRKMYKSQTNITYFVLARMPTWETQPIILGCVSSGVEATLHRPSIRRLRWVNSSFNSHARHNTARNTGAVPKLPSRSRMPLGLSAAHVLSLKAKEDEYRQTEAKRRMEDAAEASESV